MLASLVYGNSELLSYVSNDPNKLRSALKIDENIYIEKNTSTVLKMSLLRRFFVLFGADPMDLIFYLKDDETKKDSMRLSAIAKIFREWALGCEHANINIAKCNRTYTRFTTTGMSKILPNLPNAPSGWNTDNHYFYEIVNRNGKDMYIQFSISSRNITDEFRSICDRINQFYPAKMSKEDWQWRSPFKTKTVSVDSDLSKEAIFAVLDNCMIEILAFESELAQKIKIQ